MHAVVRRDCRNATEFPHFSGFETSNVFKTFKYDIVNESLKTYLIVKIANLQASALVGLLFRHYIIKGFLYYVMKLF